MWKIHLSTRHILGDLTALIFGRRLVCQYTIVHRHRFHGILLSIFKVLGNSTHSAFRLLVTIHLTIWDHVYAVVSSIFAIVVHFRLIHIFKILRFLFGLITGLKHSLRLFVH